MTGTIVKRLAPVLAVAVALAAALFALAGLITRTSAGASTDVFGPSSDVTLLDKNIRTSAPADLMLSVAAECSIVTDVVDHVNSASSSTQGQIKVWVTIDGKPVPVASGDTGADAGRVVFCNRTFAMNASGFSQDEDSAAIETYNSTRDANGFNWVAFNVGNGIHHVVVHGKLDSTDPACSTTSANPGLSGGTCSEAVVGKRTLLIEATHMAPNATTEDIGP